MRHTWILGALMATHMGCGGASTRNDDPVSPGGTSGAGGSGAEDSGGVGGTKSSGGSESNGGSDGVGASGGFGGSESNDPGEGIPPPDDFPDYATGPYGYCGSLSTGQFYCPENHAGGGGGDDCLEWCNCRVSCTSSTDCPEPDTGNIAPRCDGTECILPCSGDGRQCPEGMRCVTMHDGTDQCTWAREGEENLACWLDTHPDYCSQFSTKETCQEKLDTDPLQSPIGCIWIKEAIHALSDPSCEPASTSEACVPGVRSNECDQPEHSCPGNDSWVHFRDIGAGTSAIIVTDRCLTPDVPTARGRAKPCSFGEPTLPLLCDCGCP